MKLNLTREEAESRWIKLWGGWIQPDTLIYYPEAQITNDWLTLEAECVKRGELIEQLEKALKEVDMLCFKHERLNLYSVINPALSAVESWRKEQE